MIRIDIATDNAAFEDPAELPRIIRDIADRMERGEKSGKVRDINGNTVGRFDELQDIE